MEPEISKKLKQTSNQDKQQSRGVTFSIELVNKNVTPNSLPLINSYIDSLLMIEQARQDVS